MMPTYLTDFIENTNIVGSSLIEGMMQFNNCQWCRQKTDPSGYSIIGGLYSNQCQSL